MMMGVGRAVALPGMDGMPNKGIALITSEYGLAEDDGGFSACAKCRCTSLFSRLAIARSDEASGFR